HSVPRGTYALSLHDALPILVVHAERDAAALRERGDLQLHRLGAVLRGVGDGHRARAGHLEVGRLVLVTVRVPADDDRLLPPGHQDRKSTRLNSSHVKISYAV